MTPRPALARVSTEATAAARGRRALGLACVAPAGAAGLLWGSSALAGAQASPSLSGFAWVALAGVAGLVATGGVVRRVLAALLGLAGAAVAVIGPSGGTRAPAAVLAVAAGVVLLAAGVFVLLREPRLARLGARYAAPGARPVEVDPDRAAWQDLDAGRDPTADPVGDEGDDPDDGAGRGAG